MPTTIGGVRIKLVSIGKRVGLCMNLFESYRVPVSTGFLAFELLLRNGIMADAAVVDSRIEDHLEEVAGLPEPRSREPRVGHFRQQRLHVVGA